MIRRGHLTLIPGGKCDDERAARLRLYGQAERVVRAEPQPPTPPRAA